MAHAHKLITVILILLIGSTLLYTQRAIKAARHTGRGRGTRSARISSGAQRTRVARVGRRPARAAGQTRVRSSRPARLQPYPLRGTHYPYSTKHTRHNKRYPRHRKRYPRRARGVGVLPYGYYSYGYPYNSYIYDDYSYGNYVSGYEYESLDSQGKTYWDVTNNTRYDIDIRPENHITQTIGRGRQNISVPHEYNFSFVVTGPNGQYIRHTTSDHYITLEENRQGNIIVTSQP